VIVSWPKVWRRLKSGPCACAALPGRTHRSWLRRRPCTRGPESWPSTRINGFAASIGCDGFVSARRGRPRPLNLRISSMRASELKWPGSMLSGEPAIRLVYHGRVNGSRSGRAASLASEQLHMTAGVSNTRRAQALSAPIETGVVAAKSDRVVPRMIAISRA